MRDVYFPDGTPRGRIRLQREIAKGGRAADVFLPDGQEHAKIEWLKAFLRRDWGFE